MKLVAFAGSSREGSFNKKLLKLAVKGAEQAGADVTLIELSTDDMPIFSEDIEAAEGKTEAAKRFKAALVASDGFLIASPEHNSTYPALLKNAIDWASRADSDDEPPLAAFKGKSAVIMAASPGGYGGKRGLVALRTLLENIRVTVLDDELAIPQAHEAFDESGELIDAELSAKAKALGEALCHHLRSE